MKLSKDDDDGGSWASATGLPSIAVEKTAKKKKYKYMLFWTIMRAWPDVIEKWEIAIIELERPNLRRLKVGEGGRSLCNPSCGITSDSEHGIAMRWGVDRVAAAGYTGHLADTLKIYFMRDTHIQTWPGIDIISLEGGSESENSNYLGC